MWRSYWSHPGEVILKVEKYAGGSDGVTAIFEFAMFFVFIVLVAGGPSEGSLLASLRP